MTTKFDKLFFNPILEAKPRNIPLDEFKRAAMHVNSRIISFYQAVQDCQVGGVWVEGGVHPKPGNDYGNKLKKGQRILVRLDEYYQRYDVENQGIIRRLTAEDWTKLRLSLKLVSGEEL